MVVILIVVAVLVGMCVIGLLVGGGGATAAEERAAVPSYAGPYPNGSVPYGNSSEFPESLMSRAKRFACAGVNHHPRRYTGSWCMGYGYVCGRCYMYADPVSKERLGQMCEALNRMPTEDQQMAMAAMSGGGPTSHKRSSR